MNFAKYSIKFQLLNRNFGKTLDCYTYSVSVIIPTEILNDTVRLAREKISGENTVRDDLTAGMPVTEAFSKHGIL